MRPTKIRRLTAGELAIDWDDGHHGRHNLSSLRNSCPCASCRMETEGNEGMVKLPVLTPGKYELHSIDPVGSYALSLTWGDGHRTGIYTFGLLRQICECEVCTKKTSG